MKHDVFISQSFTHSKKSQATIKTYQKWVAKLCRHVKKPHPLDITVEDVQEYYVYLFYERRYSLPSLEVVRAALKYYFCQLLTKKVPESMRIKTETAEEIKQLFTGRRSYAKHLPQYATLSEVAAFLDALQDTNAGHALRRIYARNTPIETTLASFAPLKVSRRYLSQVAAKTARKVGIMHGFGLRGLRASGLVHRIQACTTDYDVTAIFQESGLSYQQFLKYRKAAGNLLPKG